MGEKVWTREALSKDRVECARLARTLLATGDFRAAREVLRDVPPGDDDGEIQAAGSEIEAAEARLHEADALLEAGDFKCALEKFGALEGGALSESPSLIARMGRCYLGLGDMNRVLNVSAALLRQDAADVAALLLRAEAQFQATREHIDTEAWDKHADSAMKLTRQALSLDPENRSAAQLCKRLRAHMAVVKEVRSAMLSGKPERAEELLKGVLTATANAASFKFAARCHAERALARLQQGHLDGSIADCREAARLDNRLTAAPVVEAQALQKQERWQDAVTVLEKLCEWNKDKDIYWKKEWAIFEVRRARRPDFYAILGLKRSCQPSEVKKAYLRLSAEFHPDKMCKKNPEVDPKEAQEKFTALAEAYEFLGDPQKRELYDKGYDSQGIREVLAVRKRAAGQAPCSQCGEDEAGKLGADGKWYCLRCWDSYERNKSDVTLEKSSVSSIKSPCHEELMHNNGEACGHQASAWPSGSTTPKPEDIDRMGIAELKSLLAKLKVEARGCLTTDDLRAFVREHIVTMCPPTSSLPTAAEKQDATGKAAGPTPAPNAARSSGQQPMEQASPQSAVIALNSIDWSFSMSPGRPLTTADAWTLGVGRGGCGSLGRDVPVKATAPPEVSAPTRVRASPFLARPPALTEANYEEAIYEDMSFEPVD